MPLALLWLTSFKDPVGVRAWKGRDWETMERLHTKGYMSDPKSKAKTVLFFFVGGGIWLGGNVMTMSNG
jgi:hypothetical protein